MKTFLRGGGLSFSSPLFRFVSAPVGNYWCENVQIRAGAGGWGEE